jgi:hypothetical protein
MYGNNIITKVFYMFPLCIVDFVVLFTTVGAATVHEAIEIMRMIDGLL